jgi:SAM-dependent methyltransferase
MGCAGGRFTFEIFSRLPPGGRLIVVEDNRDLLEKVRKNVGAQDRKRIFFKKEPLDKLSFADGTFDAVLSGGFPPSFGLRAALKEVTRLLNRNGLLLMGARSWRRRTWFFFKRNSTGTAPASPSAWRPTGC